VSVPWDVEVFAAASVAHHVPVGTTLSPAPANKTLMSKFPTPELGPFKEPTTLVDLYGRIIIWYLPGALDSTANVRWAITPLINAC
jgi:hypothetical protein